MHRLNFYRMQLAAVPRHKGSEEEIDLPESSDNNQQVNTNACRCRGDICSCENDEFYKLQSQFEDLNINTITFDNVIELLKKVTDNNLREKIIQLAVNNNTSSSKTIEKPKNDFEGDIFSCENDEFYKLQSQFEDMNINTITFDNVIELLKEVTDNTLRDKIIQLAANNRLAHLMLLKNQKMKIKSLKQNQIIYDHRLTQIESANNKGKNIVKETTIAKPINIDPRQNMFLGMMQIVTAHKWYEKIKLIFEQIAIDICVDHLSAFWDRKKHIVTLSYEDNFSEDDIPTKSRPCQMNAELVEFCKKEIDNLLQK
ncbi:hypothetical protein H5410_004376, partial [Solanum commersonii]